MKVVDAGVIVELVAGDLDAIGSVPMILLRPTCSTATSRTFCEVSSYAEPSPKDKPLSHGRLHRTRDHALPRDWLRPRMWALRHNLPAYDATYVALTEMTAATSLLTTDARLANAPGLRYTVQLL